MIELCSSARSRVAIDALPDPVRTTFIAAVSRVLGGLASFPAAWLRRPVQSFEDTTDARSLVTQGLANAVVAKAASDPVMMQAAMEAYLPTTIRKVANRAATISVAAEEISQSTDKGDKARIPDDDWMNHFMRHSEDASSERLQLLFGKILAGEIVNPGSFAPSTLRAVSELTQEMARDFEWAWSRNFDAAMLKTPDFNRGESWSKLTRLREAGLVSPNDASRFSPEFNPVLKGLSPRMLGTQPHWLMIYLSAPGDKRVPMLPFTRIGNELGKLLPAPNWAANLRAVADVISKSGVARIDLFSTDGVAEALWVAPAKDQTNDPAG
jgi:hypothetical protein